ncbi:DUF61 family protein [Pyrococcus yayanosii]|uniref:UPF0216 protein PYCH_18890 n=1 Tax=Pyrococcus yayanosii (strain CH1 / JCM 16557) TaxID=529709 RepID=F8AIE1_PYRYC|nr:DUF61 family protein [Pyrococcus yayanosii]AEH25544.1 hypothetical protein PYCH_18890 [Pyrococcus yayanosii CH1]
MERATRIIEVEVARINSHLPRARKTLAQLLSEEEPSITLKDGSKHYFRREELQFIASLLDEGERETLRLPIILEISTVTREHFRVRGRTEVKVIQNVLGIEEDLEERSVLELPRYLLAKVRRALPTTTTYAFILE